MRGHFSGINFLQINFHEKMRMFFYLQMFHADLREKLPLEEALHIQRSGLLQSLETQSFSFSKIDEGTTC